MGDGEKAPLRVQFNPKVCLEFHGATITSDAGLLPIRELDEALGLTDTADGYLQESRTGRNIRHHLIPLIRQSIYSRLAGYDDTNDAQRLAQDPAMRVIVGWQGLDRNAASTSEMGRFETETLIQEDNLKGLARMNFQWVAGAMAHTPHRRVILDMDSSESPVHGQQEGAAYNGHFECVCYHPLFLFNQFGDCEGATLRSGNVSSADGWQELLEPVVKGYQKKGLRLLFRGDAAFAKPELYEYLEEEKTGYAIRLPANQVVQEQIQPLLEPPTEWPSREPMVSYVRGTRREAPGHQRENSRRNRRAPDIGVPGHNLRHNPTRNSRKSSIRAHRRRWRPEPVRGKPNPEPTCGNTRVGSLLNRKEQPQLHIPRRLRLADDHGDQEGENCRNRGYSKG